MPSPLSVPSLARSCSQQSPLSLPAMARSISQVSHASSRSDEELGELPPSAAASHGSSLAVDAPAAASAAPPRRLRPPPIHTRASFEPNRDSPDAIAQLLPPGTARGTPPPGVVRRPSSSISERLSARQERRGASEMSLVAEKLWVGSEVAAASLGNLRNHGITHVINCTTLPNTHEGRAGAPSYLKLSLFDSVVDLPRMLGCMTQTTDFIRDAHAGGGTVLVHCHRGISRSCTMAMAYMMASARRSAEDVFEDVKRARRVCDPNLGYWVSLKEWEQTLALGGTGSSSVAATADAADAPGESLGEPEPPDARKRSRSALLSAGSSDEATPGSRRARSSCSSSAD